MRHRTCLPAVKDISGYDSISTAGFKRGRFPRTVIALFVFIGLSCAKQGYPPGGPEDNIAPEIVRTTPSTGETNVSRTNPVVIEFSESMESKSVEENLFIVPIPSAPPELRWRARDKTLEIVFAEPLIENSTYVISIGTKARDLRRNELEESVMLSFSTGDRIENGAIRGRIIPYTFDPDDREQVSGVDVVAYRLNGSETSPDPRDDVPDYVTQSGTDGAFEMVGLSSGIYRLFAIGDKDRNGFYTEGYDMIGVASGDAVLAEGDSVVIAPDIAVSELDTSSVQLVSIGVPDSRRVELFFDRAVEAGSVRILFNGLDIIDWFIPWGNPVVVSAATEPQISGQRYTLQELTVSDRYGNEYAPPDVVPYFTGTDKPDTTALGIAAVTPVILPPGKENVSVVFNRVLDLPAAFGDIITAEFRDEIEAGRTAPNEIVLTPKDSWREDTTYSIPFDSGQLRGVAGNRLPAEASAEFRVVAVDTLGYIEGTLEDVTAHEKTVYRLRLFNVDSETSLELTVDDTGPWSTGAVLPGRYLMRAFRDDDGDGVLYRGTIEPYAAAEPVFAFPDTIVVVSRWTNGDNTILFK